MRIQARAIEEVCLICGCSEHDACYDDVEGSCSWFVPHLCDFCVLGWTRPTYRQPLYEPPIELAA